MGMNKPVKRQFLATFLGNLLTASFGSANGWATVNFVKLQEKNTTFPSGPLAISEAATVMSIGSIGAILGNFLFLYIIEKFGSKKTIFFIGLPQIVAWLLIVYAQNPFYLYASRLIFGFVGSGQIICISTFITEISDDKVRGTLTSIFDPCNNFGTLFAFFISVYFDYADQAKINLILPIIFMCLFFGIPQTPTHLIKKQKENAARKAHKYFKGSNVAFEEAGLTEGEKPKDTTNEYELTKDDFLSRTSLKAFAFAFSALSLSMLSGINTTINYVTDIFTETGSGLSAIDCSIITTVIQIIANFVIIHVIDRFSRRSLYVVSSIATAFGFLWFAIYAQFLMHDKRFEWMGIVSISFMLFVGCLGMYPVPYIFAIEIFPAKIRTYGITSAVSLMWIVIFAMANAYPFVKDKIGLSWVFFYYFIASLVNALYGYFIQPETRGKSSEEILKILRNEK